MDLLEAPNAPYWNKVAEAAATGVKASISKGIGGLFKAADCTGGKVVLSGDVTKVKLAKLRKECLGRTADTVLALSPVVIKLTKDHFSPSSSGSIAVQSHRKAG